VLTKKIGNKIKKLVIVESPSKARYLKKLLNSGRVAECFPASRFDTIATKGHVKDLPLKSLGLRIDEKTKKLYLNFVTIKKDVVELFKKKAPYYDEIYLATDPDREGEAIAYHVLSELKKVFPPEKIYRLKLYSITESQLIKGLTEKEKLDLNLVKAQFARRAIDRLIGYPFSRLASRRLRTKVSVGRVQTPAVYFVVKRHREITNFVPQNVYYLLGSFYPIYASGASLVFTAKTEPFDSLARARESLKSLYGITHYEVAECRTSKKTINPPPPFTTARLQKEAFRKYGFPPEKTAYLAQKLYEKGHCTYVRTDSSRVSEEGLELAQNFVTEKYGPHYLELNPYEDVSQPLAQESHECIRPTHLGIPDKLTNDELRLFYLIQSYFVASQMKPAIVEVREVKIKPAKKDKIAFKKGDVAFLATGERIVFDGFLKVLKDYYKPKNPQLFFIDEGQDLNGSVNLKKEKTQPPPPISADSLIDELEKHGIGRPSTYATIVKTLKEKNYVRGKKYFEPTSLAFKIIKLFSERDKKFLIDPEFTKKMESELDAVARGEKTIENVVYGLLNKVESACKVKLFDKMTSSSKLAKFNKTMRRR
jgi:DNA topoisomerase-1